MLINGYTDNVKRFGHLLHRLPKGLEHEVFPVGMNRWWWHQQNDAPRAFRLIYLHNPPYRCLEI